MKYEEGLKNILGNSDLFWYNLINEFVESEYTDKDIALKDLETLAKNQEKFKMFARALTERKSDFAGVKKDYIDSISIEKENIKERNRKIIITLGILILIIIIVIIIILLITLKLLISISVP